MMRLLVVLFLVVLNSPESFAKRRTEWALHIDTKIDYSSFAEDYGTETNKDSARIELNPNYTWKYEDAWRFYLRPQFVADPGNKSEEERYFFDLTEANIRFKTEALTIQAGNSLYSWGVTDGYNPLDVINSKQYFDALHSRKMGATSLSFSQNFDSWDYELIYIPISRGATLPGEHSRWLPREVFVPETPDNDLVLLLPQSLNYRFTSRQNLNNAVDSNFAFRTQWRGSFLDASVSFYDGVASFPLVKPAVTGSVVQVSPKTVVQVDPDVVLNTQNYRIRHGGLSFVANKWDILFKYAGSYTQSIGEDRYLPGWTQENVAAIEKTFTLGSEGLLIAVLQHSFISSEKVSDSNLSFTEIFRNAWMLGGRLSWGEAWTASFLGLYDNTHGSHFVEAGLARRLFDTWTVTAGINKIEGSNDTPLGVYGKNDSYSLSVSRSF